MIKLTDFQLPKYFTTTISNIVSVAHASDFFLWNSQTVGLYIYALEGLECLGQYRALAGYRDQWEP